MTKRLFIMLVLLVAAPALVFAQQPQSPLTITVKGVSFKMIRVQGGTKSTCYKYSGSCSSLSLPSGMLSNCPMAAHSGNPIPR